MHLIIPTLDAGELWRDFIVAVQRQKDVKFEVMVIDSGSTDETVPLARLAGWRVIEIDPSSFNHSGTRRWAVQQLQDDEPFVVFMTQDALLDGPDALKNLLKPFEDPSIAGVYGRQIPHKNATPYASSLRAIHYGSKSLVKTLKDKAQNGIQTAFFSNSFAAYRVSTLKDVGGFPEQLPLGEDMYVCAKMLLAGFKVQYTADAKVLHSHNMSYKEEFKRYLQTGRFHKQASWIMNSFGTTHNLGMKTLFLQIDYFKDFSLKRKPIIYLDLMIRSFIKVVAYWLGKKML
jgi:rhamnosyltransferase